MKRSTLQGYIRRFGFPVLLLALAALLCALFAARWSRRPVPPQPPPSLTAQYAAEADRLLADMSQHEKICQLLIVAPEALTDGAPVTEMTPELRSALQAYPVGGLLLGLGNLQTRSQTLALTGALQHESALPLLLCADEEGGRVARLMEKLGTTRLDSMWSYRSGGTQTAHDNAQTIAEDLRVCGFNTDLAPVADVWSNPANTVIGDRAYSDDYDQAAALVAAAVTGFADGGVVSCLKHFPGHGCTAEDSHRGTAVVDKTLPTLLQEDLKPFVSGIAAGADMVMVGHLTVPAMDEAPASLSHRLVTNLLRRRLGFRGIIVTDGLQMQALGSLTDAEKAVRCLAAGNDMLLGILDVEGAVRAVGQALGNGTLPQEALDQSVLRVLRLKLSRGILPLPAP